MSTYVGQTWNGLGGTGDQRECDWWDIVCHAKKAAEIAQEEAEARHTTPSTSSARHDADMEECEGWWDAACHARNAERRMGQMMTGNRGRKIIRRPVAGKRVRKRVFSRMAPARKRIFRKALKNRAVMPRPSKPRTIVEARKRGPVMAGFGRVPLVGRETLWDGGLSKEEALIGGAVLGLVGFLIMRKK